MMLIKPRMTDITMVTLMLFLCVTLLMPGISQADADEDYTKGQKAFQQQDLLTAIEYLRSSADTGHPQAQSLLGYIYDIAEENKLALDYYQMAADQGDADGAYGLAKLYASGEAEEKDLEKAVKWYQEAAEKDHLMALEVLATAYLKGELGLQPDKSLAKGLLERAAELGHQPSAERLSNL